jgi:hypothetical protein
MLSEIDLSPAAFPSQLANSFAEQDANICCHPVMMELSFRINLSYAINHKQLLPVGAQNNSSGQMAYLTAEMDI